MPYSVPRRRSSRQTGQLPLGSSDGREGHVHRAQEGLHPSPSSSRLLHPLPINVLSQEASGSKTPPRRKGRTTTATPTPSQTSRGISRSRSPRELSSAPMELPTPPDSFSEQGSVSRPRKRRKSDNEVSSSSNNYTINKQYEKAPTKSRATLTQPLRSPLAAKRSRESVSAHRDPPSSASKQRGSIADRSMRARSNQIDQSLFSRRMSPQTELSLLQDQSAPTGFFDDLSEDDEDEVYMRDRCIYLPTRRTRDLSRARNLSSMTMSPRIGMRNGISSLGREGGEEQTIIIEEREGEEGEEEEEGEKARKEAEEASRQHDAAYHSPPIPNEDDYGAFQDMPSSDEGDAIAAVQKDRERSDGLDIIKERGVRASSPLSSAVRSEPAGSFDELFSPSAGRDLPMTTLLPMESTPLALGKRPVQGRRSTPHHPVQERKVRESLAALNSPRKAQRVPGEKKIVDLAEMAMSSSPLLNRSPNLQSKATLESLQSLSLESSRRSQERERERERERELSTVLAQEENDDISSDEDADLSHFTIVANTTARVTMPANAREEVEEDSMLSRPEIHEQYTLRPRLSEESEEILADDFVYETVIVDELSSCGEGQKSHQVARETVDVVQSAEEYRYGEDLARNADMSPGTLEEEQQRYDVADGNVDNNNADEDEQEEAAAVQEGETSFEEEEAKGVNLPSSKAIWGDIFAEETPMEPMYDEEDRVYRCTFCANEVVNGSCTSPNCGMLYNAPRLFYDDSEGSLLDEDYSDDSEADLDALQAEAEAYSGFIDDGPVSVYDSDEDEEYYEDEDGDYRRHNLHDVIDVDAEEEEDEDRGDSEDQNSSSESVQEVPARRLAVRRPMRVESESPSLPEEARITIDGSEEGRSSDEEELSDSQDEGSDSQGEVSDSH